MHCLFCLGEPRLLPLLVYIGCHNSLLQFHLDGLAGIVHNLPYVQFKEVHLKDVKLTIKKAKALKKYGALNPSANMVKNELFQTKEFFDPHDLPQVKYEMLRQVSKDERPVSEATKNFGFSRPSFYEAKKAFEQDGLLGLMPKKRGPKHAHKLNDEVMEFIVTVLEKDHKQTNEQLANLVESKFSLQVNSTSIGRAITRRKKKR